MKGLSTVAGKETDPHAVRWASRYLKREMGLDWSKWHWTLDGSVTVCGTRIVLITDAAGKLPEADDRMEKVDCRRCRTILDNGASK